MTALTGMSPRVLQSEAFLVGMSTQQRGEGMSTINEHQIARKIWIITSPWYDRRGFYAWDAHSKRAAIKKIVDNLGRPWLKLKREGWRCVPAAVTWARH